MASKLFPFCCLVILHFSNARTPLAPEYVKNYYNSPNAPPVSGPYSHAVVARGKWVFLSGQQGFEPKTDILVPGGIKPETEQALKNVFTVLKEVGGEKKDIMKMTVYLKDMKDLPAVNEVYAKAFNRLKYPARAVFEVSALPAEGRVEIDAIAVIDNGW